MAGGNGNGRDAELLRFVESGMMYAPKMIRAEYDRDELINETFLVLKSRGVIRPSKVQIRSAVIDIHRRLTHHPRTWNHRHHRNKHPKVEHHPKVPQRQAPDKASIKAETVEALRDVRRRFGTDGLAVFLMTRVIQLDARSVQHIMDFEPDSALGKSLASIGPSVEV